MKLPQNIVKFIFFLFPSLTKISFLKQKSRMSKTFLLKKNKLN